MYLAKQVQRKGRRKYVYYVLRETLWDRKTGTSKQRYLIAVGPKRTITESRARELAQKISKKLDRGVTVEDLKKVKRLRVVPD